MTAREDLNLAITADSPGMLVTKWVLLAETINSNGVKGMEINGSQDLAGWDRVGMLSVALLRAQVNLSSKG